MQAPEERTESDFDMKHPAKQQQEWGTASQRLPTTPSNAGARELVIHHAEMVQKRSMTCQK